MQNASAPGSSASPMDSDRPTATSSTEAATGFVDSDAARELEMLREIVRMLPASVTVQDDRGDFLLVNDAAAIQFNASADQFNRPDPQSHFLVQALTHRRMTALDLLQSGRSAVFEERVNSERDRRVFLTTHRPARIGDRSVLLSSATDVSRQKEMEEELFRRAYYDELTDLPTRRVIEKHVGDIIGHSGETSHFALAFLDIDNFKHINDYYGHSVGDALLVQFAKRLALDLRGTDMLSRISGDEFLLLLNPIQSQQEVAEYLELLVQRLRAPFFIDGSEIFASASIGVSLHPEHGRNYDALHQNADIAMYRVKNETKGAAVFFDSSMESEALTRMATEQSLRLAILDKRFCCAFQPKVDIRSLEIKGIEALVRLRNDDGVIQAPSTFINLAVELGLIDELTHLVLAEIMKSIDLIDETFGATATISINVAAKQAGNPEFMRAFARAIEETGCPTRFMVEVTEDAFVAKTHFQDDILPMFRALGVGISIDDFGVGYSSLSALADITADEIKIDRSFITDIHKRPRSQGILRAIESLSEALGMTVIAEGVETFEELAYLQAATKIRYAQGYYFSKPIFLEELQPQARTSSDVRGASSARPAADARPAYSRAGGRGY
ncbi:PAS domain S-box-containing protein/diguanylate cyclase (GGDEF) domain-containing protein [Bradyrhizobium sp. NFR13]|nr:PAS domain S-box-containing protein/diguanylate cyclase (GGDEF) domain-containing protein [Bradyrhizobium sp. NFR13]